MPQPLLRNIFRQIWGNNASNFAMTVKTDNPGTSNSDQFTLPLVPGQVYDFTIDWGDGTVETHNTDTSPTHTYSSAGTYQISINGTLPRIRFNNGGDKLKLLSIDNWGSIEWNSMNSAYEGCSNLVINAPNAPDLSSATSLSQAFKDCAALNTSLNHWDTSSIVNMSGMFRGCTIYNQSMNNWDVSAVTTFNEFLRDASAYDQSFSSWDVSSASDMTEMFENTAMDQDLSDWQITSLTDATEMFNGTTMSTDNYDALLNSWFDQDPNENVPFHGGNAKYSPAAAFARVQLVDIYYWLMIDGGPV